MPIIATKHGSTVRYVSMVRYATILLKSMVRTFGESIAKLIFMNAILEDKCS